MAKATATPQEEAGGIVEVSPPPVTRPREGSVKPEDAARIGALVSAGKWGSNGQGYKTKKDAQNVAGRHKRAVAVALRTEEKNVASRVWEDTERPEGSRFVFGIGPSSKATSDGDGN